MAPIRWVCISDLHLGALNSLLTNVTSDGERFGPLRSLAVPDVVERMPPVPPPPGEDPPELIVLGDLFELALTAPRGRRGHLLPVHQRTAARDGGTAAVAPHIRFVPGNHDHHLWTRGSDDRYLRMLDDDLTSTPKAHDRHSTHLLPSNEGVPSAIGFVEILAKRGSNGISVTVEQSYPNLGLVDGSGHGPSSSATATSLSPSYRVMSLLDRVFGTARSGAIEAWQLEADNGGWIDFFWVLHGRQRRHHAGHPIVLRIPPEPRGHARRDRGHRTSDQGRG